MKIAICFLCFLVLSICTFSHAQSPSQRHNPIRLGTTASPLGYYEYLPSDYSNTESSQFPVVIFFHGIGEIGNGTTELGRVLAHGPPKMVEYENKDFPFVLLSPQATKEWQYMTTSINKFIEYAKSTYKIDHDRIYVTGLSKGASGAWFYSADFNKQVAAMVPICGDGKYWDPCKYTDIPIWAFHNSNDDRIPVDKSIRMVDTIRSCGGDPYLTIYKATGHDAWTRTYKDQRMWDWLLSQRKGEHHPLKNKFPTVDAGDDKVLILPENSISLTASANDSDGNISAYIWRKTEGPGLTMNNIYSQTLELSNLVEGAYKFMVIVKDNDLGSNYDEIYVTVDSKDCSKLRPEKPRIILRAENILRSSIEADKYNWFAGEKPIAFNTREIKITDPNVEYSLIVEKNGCRSHRSSLLVPSEAELNFEEDLNIYPNPTSGTVFIKLNVTQITEISIEVMDLSGKILKEKRIWKSHISKQKEVEFELEGLPDGIYIMKIMKGNDRIIKRVEKFGNR